MGTLNYYDLLEISPNASLEIIKVAYKAQSKKYHPDNQDSGNEEMMKKLNEAYDILTDPLKKAEYDKKIKKSKNAKISNETYEKNEDTTTAVEEKPSLLVGILGVIYLLFQGIFYVLQFAWGIVLILIIVGLFTGHTQSLFISFYDWILSKINLLFN